MMARVTLSAPEPPYSVGIERPGSSMATQSLKLSQGNSPVASMAAARGAKRSSANCRRAARNARCSSLRVIGCMPPSWHAPRDLVGCPRIGSGVRPLICGAVPRAPVWPVEWPRPLRLSVPNPARANRVGRRARPALSRSRLATAPDGRPLAGPPGVGGRRPVDRGHRPGPRRPPDSKPTPTPSKPPGTPSWPPLASAWSSWKPPARPGSRIRPPGPWPGTAWASTPPWWRRARSRPRMAPDWWRPEGRPCSWPPTAEPGTMAAVLGLDLRPGGPGVPVDGGGLAGQRQRARSDRHRRNGRRGRRRRGGRQGPRGQAGATPGCRRGLSLAA